MVSLVHLAETDSTSRYLRELAEAGAPSETLVLADRQTAGRGRLDHTFESPEGGLYCSLLLRPREALSLTLLTVAAAVAAAEAIEAAVPSLSVGIKWVNDLYVGERKLAGILCESSLLPSGGVDFVIVGIGVNLRRGVLSPALAEIATSLEEASGETVDRVALAEAIADRLIRLSEDPRAVLPDYRRRQILVGRRVRVFGGGRPYTARVLGVDGEGGLTVRRGLRRRTLRYGEVSLKWKR